MVRSVLVTLMALPAIALAALCTETDFMPLTTVLVACATVSGVTPASLQSTPSPGDVAKLCQFPACKAFFISLASLRCNDAQGIALASSSAVCNGVVAGSAATTVKPSTGAATTASPATTATSTTPKPAATNSGHATVLATGAVVVASVASLM